MFGKRIHFEAILEAESDLHIGGAPAIERNDGKGTRKIAAIMRDAYKKPYLPASGLKGALRSALDGDGSAIPIFGSAGDGATSEGDAVLGNIAKLWLEDARMEAATESNLNGLGHFEPEEGAYFQTRVALNERTGANDRNKLFTREMVAKGAKFTLRGDWFGDVDDLLRSIIRQLMLGVIMGRGAKLGDGRLRIVDNSKVEIQTFEVNKDTLRLEPRAWSQKDTTEFLNSCTPKDWDTDVHKLHLNCDGPFLSVRATEEGQVLGQKTVQPLIREDKPHIQPSSIMGALRARARWLCEVERAKKNGSLFGATRNHEDNQTIDRRFDEAPEIFSIKDLQKLSAVERLFGVGGLQGRVRITKTLCKDIGKKVPMKQTSIDRVTGGVRSGFLYTETVFDHAEFEVGIFLAERAGASEDEDALFEALLDDLDNGPPLELGHGSSKGMGWFKVTVEQPEKAGE